MSYQETGGQPSWAGGDSAGDETGTSTAGVARVEAGQVGATTKEQASAVAGTAAESGKQVATEVKQQARQVTSEARTQLRSLVQQSRDELREHASAQASRAAANMQTLSQQLTALADGHPEEAGGLRDYVSQSGDKIGQYARRLQDGGLDSVVGDARSFARRRPGLFLLGAAAAGFAAGRLIRGAQAAGDGSGDSDGQPGSQGAVALPSAGTTPAALASGPDPNPPPATWATPPEPTTADLAAGDVGPPWRTVADVAGPPGAAGEG